MRVVILVPRRDDKGPRDELWVWCKAWWEREQPDMPIIEGYHTVGPFNRAFAVNRAAEQAGAWDVAVLIDSDVICDPERVREAVRLADETGKVVYPHDIRRDLSLEGSRKVMDGFAGSWSKFVHRQYPRMVSSVVVIPRRLWDEIGGFDEWFAGWGFEDSSWAVAAETFGNGTVRMRGEVWHFWHPTAVEGKRGTETHDRNSAKGRRYRAASGDRAAIRVLQEEGRAVISFDPSAGVPKILHRVVPERTTREVEKWWAAFAKLHPDWELMTHRDPLTPVDWPETSAKWEQCANGAQLAGLIRLEALFRWGGVYVDSDVEPLRPLDPLLSVSAFAAWEDQNCVPDAVIGAAARHPAIRACLDLALSRVPGDTWKSGPGVTTAVLPGRSDVLLLPPGSFYPYHYREKHRRTENFRKAQPWAFAVHHWAGSWVKKEGAA